MKKRGLSGVIVTLLIVLLAIVAVGIVWVVISNLLAQNEGDINRGGIFIDFDVKSVKVNSGSIDVKVKRNSGSGEITALKFLVSDGVNSQTFEEPTTMDELSERTFTLTYTGLVKSVSVAPVFKDGKVGAENDMLELTNKEIIKNLGGVSWWKLDGNAQDEIGGNHGTIIGANWDNGKFGEGFNNRGSNSSCIVIPGTGSLQDINDDGHSFSLSIWFNPNGLPLTTYQGYIFYRRGHHEGIQHPISRQEFRYTLWYSDDTSAIITGGSSYNTGEWYHLVVAIDEVSNQGKLYVNGVQYGGTQTITKALKDYAVSDWDILCYLGSQYTANGIADEAMIFNRALTDEEVKALYELDLG